MTGIGGVGPTHDEYLPFREPFASQPEPEAVLEFGKIRIHLTYTYVHRLYMAKGWHHTGLDEADDIMQQAMYALLNAMGKAGERLPGTDG